MNIPKFGSFRPKPTTEGNNKNEDTSSSRSKRPSRDSEKPDKGHRSRSRERVRVTESVLPTRSHEADLRTFVIDRNGDERNLVYGGLHRYEVPNYRRVGAGCVLGVQSSVKIQRELSDEKGIVLSSVAAIKYRKREKYVFSKMERPRLLKIRPEAVGASIRDTGSEFISLESHYGKKRRKVARDTSDQSNTEDEVKHYRSIHGKAKDEQFLDQELQYVSDAASSEFEQENELLGARSKNIDLSRKVERHPQNVIAWIELINHQDNLLHGRGEYQRTTNAELQSTAEIKIHMYEKALESANTLSDKELLLSGLMNEGAKIWEVREQMQKWEQIAEQHLESVSLWKQYLDFKQTTFQSFQYEEIRGMYLRRYQVLLQKMSEVDTLATGPLSKQLIYILLRYTLFTQESGFTELAVSLWQAILELNFRAPASIHDWKAKFKDYWESEVSRLGEAYSNGWAAFHADPNDIVDMTVKKDEDIPQISTDRLFRNWATAERCMQQNARTPARTLDETIEDDPFRVILFSDIEDFLFILPDLQGLRELLLDSFLLFCHQSQFGTKISNWSQDAFLEGPASALSTDLLERHDIFRDAADRSILSVLDTKARNYQAGPETYFSARWFQAVPNWRKEVASTSVSILYTWIHNTLHQLLHSAFNESLGEYVLAFEWRNEPEGIKKVAKSLLKKHSESLRLYNAYALIEWARGNKAVASDVFAATLNMSSSMSTEKQTDDILLWRSWTWCCLEDGDRETALKQILCTPNGIPNSSLDISPAAIIRARNHLVSRREYLLGSNSITTAILYAELVALLAYLTTTCQDQLQSKAQGDITAYLTEMTTFSDVLASRDLDKSDYHEAHLQSSARLFFTHAQNGPFRPSLLRSTITNYLSYFPSNAIFLSLFEWNESRFRIENRVRTFFNVQTKLVLSQHIFRICHELRYGTIYSVRASFEHAVHVTSEARANAGIWKSYILFTAKHFKVKTREVWYRALRACPWVKELYLVGFEVLDEELDMHELIQTWRVLGEKGLRVHVDLEDIFDEIK